MSTSVVSVSFRPPRSPISPPGKHSSSSSTLYCVDCLTFEIFYPISYHRMVKERYPNSSSILDCLLSFGFASGGCRKSDVIRPTRRSFLSVLRPTCDPTLKWVPPHLLLLYPFRTILNLKLKEKKWTRKKERKKKDKQATHNLPVFVAHQVLIELARYGEKPVGELEAIRLADRVGARTYVESSALTQRNLKEVFDEAIVAALSSNEDLRRLTTVSSSAGRSRTGNRLLNSIRDHWRLSQSSGSTERGGLLLRCSMRRSKMADSSTTTSSTTSTGGVLRKQPTPKKKKPSVWKRLFCCHCCCCCCSTWRKAKRKTLLCYAPSTRFHGHFFPSFFFFYTKKEGKE